MTKAGSDGADGIWWDTETPREDPSEAAGWTMQFRVGGIRRRCQLAGKRTDSMGAIAARAAQVARTGHHALPVSRRARGFDGSIVIVNGRVIEAVAIPKK